MHVPPRTSPQNFLAWSPSFQKLPLTTRSIPPHPYFSFNVAASLLPLTARLDSTRPVLICFLTLT
ncbi:hypothetical protein CGMCC3_g7452 [Colletotrichum fructicola]|nr:uncharacterized protein CGMCC3_g7452 [Colletotrichum fructicola]KAE9576423.1 hypothetical protein CGMCC3_g7452 [Colletotrichum fructicola]